jgi:DNA-binding beta-propeller fold protein YncE
LQLVATYDSAGPDAFDAKAHPMVYFTSEGGTGKDGKELFPGLHIIDASSKEIVASMFYDLGAKVSPHTVGVSPDGRWAYLQGARMLQDGKTSEDVVFVINARTLKLAQILKQESVFQGAKRIQRLHHVISFVDSKGQDRVVLEFGFGSNGGPHFILDPKDNGKVVKAITTEDTGYWMGHPFLTVDPARKFLYIGLKMAAWAEVTHEVAGIAKINLETWAVTIIPGVGQHLIGMAHTADGKFLYVNDAEESRTVKIDTATNKVVGKTSAGVAGPYGLAMNWDETELYAIGKGEGSHNTGSMIGVIDLKTFVTKRGIINPIPLLGSARSIDHGFLHPDPKVNELWVSNMAGSETIVLDLATRKVKTYIATPLGGNTHSGAFVRYSPDWKGEVLADHGGPQTAMYQLRLTMVKTASAQ